MSEESSPPLSKECRLCHRIGTQSFVVAGSEEWECSNDRACQKRVIRRKHRDRRPRARCPHCKRSIAVTFEKRTGFAFLRPHKAVLGSLSNCPRSGGQVSRQGLS